MTDMKFKFTVQPYQTEAVESVTRSLPDRALPRSCPIGAMCRRR